MTVCVKSLLVDDIQRYQSMPVKGFLSDMQQDIISFLPNVCLSIEILSVFILKCFLGYLLFSSLYMFFKAIT